MVAIKTFFSGLRRPDDEELAGLLNKLMISSGIMPEEIISVTHTEWVTESGGRFTATLYYKK